MISIPSNLSLSENAILRVEKGWQMTYLLTSYFCNDDTNMKKHVWLYLRTHTYVWNYNVAGRFTWHPFPFRDQGRLQRRRRDSFTKLEKVIEIGGLLYIYICMYTCMYVYTLRCWGHSGISGWEPSLPSAAQHVGVQWNLTNTHICSTKRNLVCDGLKWTLAQTFVIFRRFLAFRRSEAPKETGAIWGGESQVGPWFLKKQYSAWWFQKYVRLLILDFKISEAGNWKNWKIDFKNWMHPKIKQKLPNIAILGIMAPTDSSFLGLKAVGSCRRWVGTACQELGDLRCGWEILVAKHRGYW